MKRLFLVAAIAVTFALSERADARWFGSHGSEGSFGGSHGSFGGSHGSNGSEGSFGGSHGSFGGRFFARRSHGSCGSAGGHYVIHEVQECDNCNNCDNGNCSYQNSSYSGTRRVAQTSRKQFWPFDDGSEVVQPVEPDLPPNNVPPVVPQPTPVEPEPQPNPPDFVPQPDPAPLPPNPPAPDATPDTPALPTDHAELCTHIAKKLGGYNRANYERDGTTYDIYQARGKQRVVWVVDYAANWQTAFIKAFLAKAKSGAAKGGIALVCHCPAPDAKPEPEPVATTKVAAAVKTRLFKSGGDDLVDAGAACQAAGLWLVVVHDADGSVNRVIYGN